MKFLLIVLLMPASAFASSLSISSLGINSIGLLGPGDELLTGAGVKIGQVETLRPADTDVDDTLTNSSVDPEQVWVLGLTPSADYIGETGDTTAADKHHPTSVAGVMISTDGVRRGVATEALLYANAYVVIGADEVEALRAIQKVWTGAGGDVRAINNSWGKEFPSADGTSQLTLGADGMATRYDTLLVFALNPDERPDQDAPGDNYNGITVDVPPSKEPMLGARIQALGASRRRAIRCREERCSSRKRLSRSYVRPRWNWLAGRRFPKSASRLG